MTSNSCVHIDKFRCGVAPLRLETGRYEGLPADERKCPFCWVHVEDEKHVLLQCKKYNTIRENLFQKAVTVNVEGFKIYQIMRK